MSRIIQLLIKNHILILFIFLQATSFQMMNSNNFVVESKLTKQMSEIRGFILLKKSEINTYFLLKKENENLLEKNQKIITENLKLKSLLTKKNEHIVDSTNENNIIQQAKVVQNTWKKNQNYMIINKGINNGVSKNMGVIDNNQLVGIIHHVSNSFATVISLINTDLMISSKLKKEGHYGSMTWTGKNYRSMLLLDIPKHADIKIGDTVITSGYSNIFPEGIDIGTVESYRVQKNTNFLEIIVNLFIDFTNINYVYIIKNSLQEERMLIEKQTIN